LPINTSYLSCVPSNKLTNSYVKLSVNNSLDHITRPVKIMGIVNLVTIVLVWAPLSPGENGFGFSGLDNLSRGAFLLWLLFSLQGLLVFLRKLAKWDIISATVIVVASISFWIVFEEPLFLIAAVPEAIYFILQIWRGSISNNFKVGYLNIWNITIVIFVLIKFWAK